MPYPIELVMPDPHSYDLRINELQRKLMLLGMRALRVQEDSGELPQLSNDEYEVMLCLEDMLTQTVDNPLAIVGLNSFVL